MKTLAYTLFLSLALCASNVRANTIHDIIQSGSIDPIDFYTGSQGLSFTAGEVHWQLRVHNAVSIDQDHLVVVIGANLISGTPPDFGTIFWARQAFAAVASKLEIEEYHPDAIRNGGLIMDEPRFMEYYDVTVPETISTLPLLIAALAVLIVPAFSFNRFAPALARGSYGSTKALRVASTARPL
jgi:hypothetical protein